MANEQNLKPKDSNQSREEAKKNGRKGGIASGKSRREKRTLREQLLALLDGEHKTSNGEMKTMREIISLGLLKRAAEGDPQAFRIIRDTIGEDPVLRVDHTTDGKALIPQQPTAIHVVYNGEEFTLTAADVD